MEFVKLIRSSHGSYSYEDASNIAMTILSRFLANDARYNPSSFKEYAFNDWEECTSSNLTSLRKEHGYIFLSDLYSEEKIPTELKISLNQFIQLLSDWEEKVHKLKPKEIIIKHENGQFIVETKD